MLRRPGDHLLHALIGKGAAIQEWPVNGYLCATLWDWEQARDTQNATVPISSFAMKFQVPLPPPTPSNQTIFLFNGIQPSRTTLNKAILQPVLQWGNQDDPGGGQFWSVSSWFVRGESDRLDLSARTKAVRVEPGTNLEATITLYDVTDGVYSYVSEFSGIPQSSLVVGTSTELVRAITALECYKVADETELPSSHGTSFENVEIFVGTHIRASPKWEVINVTGTSGVQARAVAHNGIEDEVDIRYRCSS